MKEHELLAIRYFRMQGLQLGEIGELLGMSGHQVPGYQMKQLRKKWLENNGSKADVNFNIEPCHDSLECSWCSKLPEPNYSCPVFVWASVSAQLEDLPKHDKLRVLMNMINEVEQHD